MSRSKGDFSSHKLADSSGQHVIVVVPIPDDPLGPLGVLILDNCAHFERMLTYCSPCSHMNVPSCTLQAYLRATVWSHVELVREVQIGGYVYGGGGFWPKRCKVRIFRPFFDFYPTLVWTVLKSLSPPILEN